MKNKVMILICQVPFTAFETKAMLDSTFLVWTIPDRKRENMGNKNGSGDEYMHVGNLNFKTSIHL